MISLTKALFAVLISLFLINCSGKFNSEQIEIVNLAEAYHHHEQSSANISFFSNNDVEYVKLQAPQEIVIDENHLRVYANSSNIILIGFRQIYLFDRQSGSFIREIGKFGKGPNEYSATLHNNAYDYTRNVIIVMQWDPKKFFEYNLKGEVTSNLDFSCPNIDDFSGSVSHYKDNIFLVYYNNSPNNKQQKLKLIDTDCNVLNTYYHSIVIKEEPHAFSTGLSVIYKYHDDLMFFENFVDTIYNVSQSEINARFLLNLGEFKPPYEKQFDFNYYQGEFTNHFHINKLFESARYLFIRYSFDDYWFWHAVYDKKTKTTTMQIDESGIENDIDVFVPLRYATSVNNEDELIGFIEAYNVADWFRSNPEKAAKLPDSLQKFQAMTASDPPLIMIMKLKQ